MTSARTIAGLYRLLNRFAANTRGTAAVESAFIYPLYLALGFFVLEGGRIAYSNVELQYALHTATRHGMVNTVADVTAVRQALSNRFVLLSPAHITNVQMNEINNGDNTRTATLTVTYTVDLIIPFTTLDSITLTKSATFLRGT